MRGRAAQNRSLWKLKRVAMRVRRFRNLDFPKPATVATQKAATVTAEVFFRLLHLFLSLIRVYAPRRAQNRSFGKLGERAIIADVHSYHRPQIAEAVPVDAVTARAFVHHPLANADFLHILIEEFAATS